MLHPNGNTKRARGAHNSAKKRLKGKPEGKFKYPHVKITRLSYTAPVNLAASSPSDISRYRNGRTILSGMLVIRNWPPRISSIPVCFVTACQHSQNKSCATFLGDYSTNIITKCVYELTGLALPRVSLSINLVRSPWQAHVVCVPRLRQHQSHSRMLLSHK